MYRMRDSNERDSGPKKVKAIRPKYRYFSMLSLLLCALLFLFQGGCLFPNQLPGNPQHAKMGGFLLGQNFVVHFVQPTNGPKIGGVDVSNPAKTLMNEQLVHEKISQAVGSNPESKAHRYPDVIHHAQHDAQPTWDGENQEKGIVFFKKTRLLGVVVCVQKPQPTVHEVFVRRPSSTFHQNKRGYTGQKGSPVFHNFFNRFGAGMFADGPN